MLKNAWFKYETLIVMNVSGNGSSSTGSRRPGWSEASGA